MPSYTIGQLARAAAVPISTLRFYERTRLLTPTTRSDGNYRQYDSAALERLRFIRAAQATGFSIEDIRELLSLTHSDEAPCDDVLSLMTNRLSEVRERFRATWREAALLVFVPCASVQHGGKQRR